MRYVGFWRRFAAQLIDQTIIFTVEIQLYIVVLLPLKLIFVPLENILSILGAMLFLVASLCYSPILIHVYGQTVGKKIMGIIVVNKDGKSPSIEMSLMREIIGKYILNQLSLGIGYLLIIFNKEKQGLHDKIAGTHVIYNDSKNTFNPNPEKQEVFN